MTRRAPIEIRAAKDEVFVVFADYLRPEDLAEEGVRLLEAVPDNAALVIDLSALECLDALECGFVVELLRRCRKADITCREHVRQTLELLSPSYRQGRDVPIRLMGVRSPSGGP